MDEYLNLKDQIQTWQGLISGSNPSTKGDVERVFQTFDKRISDLAEGCLMRNIDFKVHADIVQLLPIIRKARQVHLKRSGLVDKIEYEHDGDDEDDEAFLSTGKPEDTEATSTPKSSCDDALSQGSQLEDTSVDGDITVGGVINNIIQLKSSQEQFVPNHPLQVLLREDDNAAFSGFSTVMEEIQVIKNIMEKNRKAAEAKDWKLEKRLATVSTDLKKTERITESLQANINELNTAVNSNTVRIGRLEDKAYNLSLSIKGIEAKVMKRVVNLELWMECATVEKQLNLASSPTPSDTQRTCSQNF